MFELKSYIFTDLSESKNIHESISGGKASHSLDHYETKTFGNLKDLNEYIIRHYAPIEYDDVNENYISHIDESLWNEKECPEYYMLNINQVTKRPIGPEEL